MQVRLDSACHEWVARIWRHYAKDGWTIDAIGKAYGWKILRPQIHWLIDEGRRRQARKESNHGH